MKKVVFASCLLLVCLISGRDSFAAARLEPLTIGYSNFTGTYAPLWIAVEERLGAKHGLDLKAIYRSVSMREGLIKAIDCRPIPKVRTTYARR